MGSTPVGSTRIFLFLSIPVSLTEKHPFFTLITRLKKYTVLIQFHHCANTYLQIQSLASTDVKHREKRLQPHLHPVSVDEGRTEKKRESRLYQ